MYMKVTSRRITKTDLLRDEVKAVFWDDIERSWSYAKLTQHERERIKEICLHCTPLFGKKQDMFTTLHTVYHAFLVGTGYDPNSGWRTWRSPQTNDE